MDRLILIWSSYKVQFGHLFSVILTSLSEIPNKAWDSTQGLGLIQCSLYGSIDQIGLFDTDSLYHVSLSVFLFFCLFICLSFYLSISQSIYLSLFLFICLSSVCFSIYTTLSLSVFCKATLAISTDLFIHATICALL